MDFSIGYATFNLLVAKLKNDPIFMSTGPQPQQPVQYQLAASLMHYATVTSNTLGTALKLAISQGLVINYCHQVVRALQKIGVHVIFIG